MLHVKKKKGNYFLKQSSMVFYFLRFNIAIWECRFTLLIAVLKISPSSQNINLSSRASIAFSISIFIQGTFGSSIATAITVLSSSSGTSPRISAMISASLGFSPFVNSSASTSKSSALPGLQLFRGFFGQSFTKLSDGLVQIRCAIFERIVFFDNRLFR